MSVPPAGDDESRPTDAPEPGEESSDRPAVPPPPPPQDLPAPPPPPGPPGATQPPTEPPVAAPAPPAAPSEAPTPPSPAEPGPSDTQEITPATTVPAAPLWTPPPWTGPQQPTVPPGTHDWATTAPVPPAGAPQWGPHAPPGVPPYPAYPAPKRRRRGLLITAIVLAGVLVLCGGGGLAGYLVLRDVDTGEGAAEPVAAVESFLDAVYVKQNATAANALVCGESRDPGALQDKVDEIQRYARTYPNPRYKWDPPKVEQQDAEKALVSTRLTVLTADDRSTAEQLRFTVVHKTGWWVCDVG